MRNLSANGEDWLNDVSAALQPYAYSVKHRLHPTVSSDNGTATNVNGTSTFQGFNQLSPNASQLSFASSNGQRTDN
jgi:hypothetical protein